MLRKKLTQKGESFVVELTPRFYSTWDMSGDTVEH